MDEREYRPIEYIIPANLEGDRTIGGIFKFKCLIEAIAFFFATFAIWKFSLFSFDVTVKTIGFCLIVLPITALAAIGIKGESLIEYMLEFVNFRRKRRKMIFKIPREMQQKKKKRKEE